MTIDKCFVISRNCWGEHNAKSTFSLPHLRLPFDYIPNFFQITFIMHVVQYFNRFGWLVYIYCVLGLQLGHLVLISWEIPLVIYFVLFKLFQSYLSTSLNIRWINFKKQISFHLVIHILSHGSTQLTIHLEVTVLYHRCLGGSVFERVGWSTKYPYINLTHFHKELKQDLIIKYVNLYFIFMTNWYHIAACDTIKSPDN